MLIINGMAWESPQYTVNQVKKAGSLYIDSSAEFSERLKSLDVINNWRASHQYPLNIITDGLRKKSYKIEPKRLVAQRIKRLPAIEAKLKKESMKLNQMQDIGGCRVVFSDIDSVHELVKNYKRYNPQTKESDYLSKPRSSGYRGIHLIHKYHSDKQMQSAYNGLQIEMQIRTLKQHIWATAVETVGFFIDQPLKQAQGDKNWQRFFALMSCVIARQEGCALVPETPHNHDELVVEIKKYNNKLGALGNLLMYGRAVKITQEGAIKGKHYFLMQLDSKGRRMTIHSYPKESAAAAQDAYQRAEQSAPDDENVLLVSADSFAALKKAYPNYFHDTQKFVTLLSVFLNVDQCYFSRLHFFANYHAYE